MYIMYVFVIKNRQFFSAYFKNIYQFIIFLQTILLRNNILQLISDIYREKLVNKDKIKIHYYKSNKITQ